jgi:hypothetical protein
VKVWDTSTGQLLLSLEGHDNWILGVAFRCDSQQIATAGVDNTVRLWEAAPLSAQGQELRQALGVLDFLCRNPKTRAEVVPRLQRDLTISDAVRRQALRLAPAYQQGLSHAEADDLIWSLQNKLVLQPDILKEVATAPGLDEAVRQQALSMAKDYVETPENQHAAARRAVHVPDQDASVYALALERALTACSFARNDPVYRTTLGMAHFRLHQYPQALEALTRAGQTSTRVAETVEADRRAFLAMTQWELGEVQQARQTLEDLRDWTHKTPSANQPDAKASLAEAQARIAGPAPRAAK